MSQATDLLNEWIVKAQTRAPSITRTSAQPWPGVGPPPNFKPGISSYGWGINGRLVKDGGGNNIGLAFGGIHVWFSDRGQNVSNPPPNSGDQFKGDAADVENLTFTLAGDAVEVQVQSVTWGGTHTALTTIADVSSQQLVFGGMPPAGPDPVRSVLIVSFADTGQFGWL